MTCIKTGARVYFANYGVVAPADIFAVAGAVVVRTPARLDSCSEPHDGAPEFTHTLQSEPRNEEFWRPDLGVFVVPAYGLTEKKS